MQQFLASHDDILSAEKTLEKSSFGERRESKKKKLIHELDMPQDLRVESENRGGLTEEVTVETLDPSHILLSLMASKNVKPLHNSDHLRRAISILDRIPSVQTTKVGLLYVGDGQTEIVNILSNQTGSADYYKFLKNLGQVVKLSELSEIGLFTGGLDPSDGVYTLLYKDHVEQIMFHVATLMPNSEEDPNCYNKLRHIGNDHVVVVWKEGESAFSENTISGQFNVSFAFHKTISSYFFPKSINIIITPLTGEWFSLTLQTKHNIPTFLESPQLVSGFSTLISLVIQLIEISHVRSLMHFQRGKTMQIVSTNILERFREIRKLEKLIDE